MEKVEERRSRHRRRLGPPQEGINKSKISSEVRDSWELIGETESLSLNHVAEPEPETCLQDFANEKISSRLVEDEDLDVALLLPLEIAESLSEKRKALSGSAMVEALIENSHGRARHKMVRKDEFWNVSKDGNMIIVPFADEMDGVSTKDLINVARSGSEFDIIVRIKRFILQCVRPPTWKASMATELDSLATNCFQRSQTLQRLHEAKKAYEKRIESAKQFISKAKDTAKFGSTENIKVRAETLVINQLSAQIKQVDKLINHYADSSSQFLQQFRAENASAVKINQKNDDGYQADTETSEQVTTRPMEEKNNSRVVVSRPPNRALIDAILAMILLRTPPLENEFPHNFHTRRRDLHEELVESWRNELGVLPGPLDTGGDPLPSAAAALIAGADRILIHSNEEEDEHDFSEDT